LKLIIFNGGFFMAGTSTNPDIYAIKFGTDIFQQAKQGASKLLGCVHNKGIINGKAYTQPRIGTWTMTAKAARGSKNAQNDAALSNRFISMATYEDSRVWTKEDEWKTLAEIGSPAMVAAADSLGNRIDSTIISALGGTAYAGEAGGTSVTLPTTQIVAVGSTNLSVAKIAAAAKKLDENKVSANDRFAVISPSAIHSLLSDSKVGSTDYNTVKALLEGTLDKWYGFRFIMSTNLSLSTNTRRCFFYQKNAVSIGFACPPTVRFDELIDQSYDKQIFYTVSLGSGRLEEESVVAVDVDESK
jgi:hypothetical protein